MASAVLAQHRSRRTAAVASVVFAAVVTGLRRLAKPKSASLVNLRKMPFTVCGLGCVDVGVFTASTVAGWIVTGFSLMLLEFMISDES